MTDERPSIWLDGDGSPAAVREVLFRAAERRSVPVTVVANRHQSTPKLRWIRMVVVESGIDVADDYIVAHCRPGDLVVTNDVPLAAEVIERGAIAMRCRGELLTEANVRQRLATRDMLDALRGGGVVTGGPPPYSPSDKQRFANTLDRWLTASGW
ncbi:MAG: YaiI/YqxD family protein [Deltaproteobacteria bacterium]|nr:MAG: YaiI/YqxD family protein [Deltaproteobacteria bacterium]